MMCNILLNGIGMVCPRSGEFFAIETSHSNAATDQAFLDEADKSILNQLDFPTLSILIVILVYFVRKTKHLMNSFLCEFINIQF